MKTAQAETLFTLKQERNPTHPFIRTLKADKEHMLTIVDPFKLAEDNDGLFEQLNNLSLDSNTKLLVYEKEEMVYSPKTPNDQRILISTEIDGKKIYGYILKGEFKGRNITRINQDQLGMDSQNDPDEEGLPF